MASRFDPLNDLIVNRSDGQPAYVIEGLKQFQRELRNLEGTWNRELRTINLAFAKSARDAAESEADRRGSVFRHVAHNRGGFKARATQRQARVELKHPAGAGAEFGSKKWPQFKPYIGGRAGTGYMIYGSLDKYGEKWRATYFDSMIKLAEKAFPN